MRWGVAIGMAGILLVIAMSTSARAQAVELGPLRDGVELNGSFAWHAGDDPAWANVDFDDASWPRTELTSRERTPSRTEPVAWFRLRVRIDHEQSPQPLYLVLTDVHGSAEVYVDGSRIGTIGQMQPYRDGVLSAERFVVPATSAEDGELVLALRHRWDPGGFGSMPSRGRFLKPLVLAGEQGSTWVTELATTGDATNRAAHALLTCLFLLIGLYHLWAWRLRPDAGPAHGWFAVWGLALATTSFFIVVRGWDWLLAPSTEWELSRGYALSGLIIASAMEFSFHFLFGRGPPWWVRGAQAALLIAMLLRGWAPGPIAFHPGVRAILLYSPVLLLATLAWGVIRRAPDSIALFAMMLFPLALGLAYHALFPEAEVVGEFTILFLMLGITYLLLNRRNVEVVESRAELQLTHDATQRFVPYPFLALLGRSNVKEVARGDSAQIVATVLFSDIRGFTSISEQHSPADNFAFINSYLERVEPAITTNNGFINQYYGDGVLAIFPGSADDGVKAAPKMREALATWNDEREKAGSPAIEIGIGLNTGELMVGTIGGSERLDTGVISDVVNTCARVESLTKLYGSRVLVTDATRSALRHVEPTDLRELDTVLPKGKGKPLSIFELLSADPPKSAATKQAKRDAFASALATYRQGNFHEAHQAFAALAPTDPAAELFAERSKTYSHTPPKTWQGITTLQLK